MAPGSAESTCATTSPEPTCETRAPSARMSAEARRASITVAHVVKIALSAARTTSMIVITVSICSSRVTTGSDRPPAVSDADAAAAVASLLLTVAWNESTATMPVTVTAMFAALSSARRGRRATSLSPNSTGTGRPADILISAPRRRGGRATSLIAATVLVRAARMAGTSVAARATASATPMTSIAVTAVTDGTPGAPTRAAPGFVSSGAASDPATSPAAAASSASARFSARNIAATIPGVPPTAFSSPTRRAYSDSRRPTSTVTLAIASSASSSAPGSSTDCASWTSSASAAAIPSQVEYTGPRYGGWNPCGPLGCGGGTKRRAANESASAGLLSFRSSA